MKMRVETQFTVFLLNRPGVLSEVTETLANAGVNLLALSISDAGEHGVLRIICEDAEDNVGNARKVLRDTHDRWDETAVLVTPIDNSPGAFASLVDKFAANRINISYAYFSAAEDGRATSAIFEVSDLKKALDLGFEPDTELRERYIEWIKQFDPHYVAKWSERYENDPQAAMCEAAYWEVLQGYGVEVKPNDNIEGNQRSPDFLCHKNGEKFYVEVTCLHISTATLATRLPHGERPKCQSYYNPIWAIFDKVKKKVTQCASLDAPALVAVGTFHSQVSDLVEFFIEELATGKAKISFHMGKLVMLIDHELAVCQKSNLSEASGFSWERLPVSGILVGGFGCKPPNIYGLLHPKPNRPFKRELLDQIKFCRLREDGAKGTLSPEWI